MSHMVHVSNYLIYEVITILKLNIHMEKAHISKLRIYPIKSLGHVEVEEAEIGIRSLKYDRQFAMVDENGRYVNGKRTGRVNQLQSKFDLSTGSIWLAEKGNEEAIQFELRAGNADLDKYLSEFFDIKLNLVQNDKGEFMDIPAASSVTVVSEASLKALQKDLDRHSLESMRLRFRTNVELAGVGPYWEEQLFQQPGIGMRFRMGKVEMIGVSPRARCNVPPQDPNSGEMDYHFVKNMIASRNTHLPEGSTLLQYGRTAYFLTVNVYLPETQVGKKLYLNDEIEILEPVDLNTQR